MSAKDSLTVPRETRPAPCRLKFCCCQLVSFLASYRCSHSLPKALCRLRYAGYDWILQPKIKNEASPKNEWSYRFLRLSLREKIEGRKRGGGALSPATRNWMVDPKLLAISKTWEHAGSLFFWKLRKKLPAAAPTQGRVSAVRTAAAAHLRNGLRKIIQLATGWKGERL